MWRKSTGAPRLSEAHFEQRCTRGLFAKQRHFYLVEGNVDAIFLQRSTDWNKEVSPAEESATILQTQEPQRDNNICNLCADLLSQIKKFIFFPHLGGNSKCVLSKILKNRVILIAKKNSRTKFTSLTILKATENLKEYSQWKSNLDFGIQLVKTKGYLQHFSLCKTCVLYYDIL
jgi:hypothetical protein